MLILLLWFVRQNVIQDLVLDTVSYSMCGMNPASEPKVNNNPLSAISFWRMADFHLWHDEFVILTVWP